VWDAGITNGSLNKAFAATDPVFLSFNWRHGDANLSDYTFVNLNGAAYCNVDISTDKVDCWHGAWVIDDAQCNGADLQSDTWYSVKIKYVADPGGSTGELYWWCKDGKELDLPIATDAADASATNGQDATTANDLTFLHAAGQSESLYDNILVSEADPYSNTYCATASWQDYTYMSWEGDHTDDTDRPCSEGGDGYDFTVTGTATIATPAQASPTTATATCTGGNALLVDSAGEYLDGTSEPGQFDKFIMRLCGRIDGNGTGASGDTFLYAEQTAAQDLFHIWIDLSGQVHVTWEDDNAGAVSVGTGLDVDSGCGGANCYGHWWVVEVQMDPTRCTDGDGACNDAGEDEMSVRYVADTDDDGDFADEAWSAWVDESSDHDFDAWATDPSKFCIGDYNSQYTQDMFIDGVQFNQTFTWSD
jgi:hypothetical protein